MEKQEQTNEKADAVPVAGNLTDDDLTGVNHGALYPNSPLKYLTALSIIGDKVHNEAGEHMGEIKDIMIDVVTGKIDYFIIEFGGFLGIGIKYFAIPFSLLRVDAENKLFIFNQEKKPCGKPPASIWTTGQIPTSISRMCTAIGVLWGNYSRGRGQHVALTCFPL